MRNLILFSLLSFIAYSQVYEYSPTGYVGGYSGSNIEIKITDFSSSNKTCTFTVRKADGTNFGSAVTVKIRRGSISGPDIKTFTISSGTNNKTSSSYYFGGDFSNTNSVKYYAISTISGYDHKAGPVEISQRLATPTLASPSNGATSISMPVQLSWNSVTSASTYRVQVSKSSSWNEESGFSSVYDEFTTTNTSFSWDQAEFGVKYYWSVRAGSNSIANSKYSIVRNFTTKNNTRPVLSNASVNPSSGYVGGSITVRVKYYDADGDGADTKKIHLSTNGGSTFISSYIMDFESGSGSTSNGYYTVTVNNLQAASYYCKFDFTDGTPPSSTNQATPIYVNFNVIQNTRPVLSNASVNPSSGYVGGSITVRVKYYDADGDGADTKKIHLSTNGGSTFISSYIMDFESGSGSTSNGYYTVTVNNLQAASYYCKFDFTDGTPPSSTNQATPIYVNFNVSQELVYPKSSDKPLSGSVNFTWNSFSPGENYLLKVRDITDDPDNGPIVFHQNCGTQTNFSVNGVLKPGRQYRWVAYTSTKTPVAINFSCGLGIIGVSTSNQLRSATEGVTFELTAGGNAGNINAFVYIYDRNNNLVNSGNENLNYVLNSNPIRFKRFYMLNEGEYKLRFRIFDESNPNLSVWYPSSNGLIEGPKIENYIERNSYKVGVVYHLDNINSASYDLDQMISELGDGVTSFSDGQKTVDLVVQTEIKWSETETSYNEFNFTKYQQFAQLCKDKGIKWSPLISYHYQPSWIVSRTTSEYGYDPRMRDHNGMVSPGNFMPYSPSSPVWTSYATNWTEAVFNFLTPYLENTVEEVFVGNEMMYSGSVLTSYDEYSRKAWRTKHGDLSELPETLNDDFQKFRTDEWGKAISSILTKAQLKAQGYNVVVTSKFYSYYLHPTQVQNVPNFGVNLTEVERLSKSLGAIGTDEYPPNPTWYGILPHLSKPIYMSEFNKRDIDIPPYATENEVYNWLTQAAEKHTRYFSFYAWNPTGNPGVKYTMNSDHRRALKRFIFSLVPFQGNAHNEQPHQEGFDFEQNSLTAGNTPVIDSVHVVGAEYLGGGRYSVQEGSTISLRAIINRMQNDSIGIFWDGSGGEINSAGGDFSQVNWQVPSVIDSNSNTATHELILKVSNGYNRSAVKVLHFDVRRIINYQNIDYSSQDFTPPVISFINLGEIDTLYHNTYFDISWQNPTDNKMVTRVKTYYIYKDTLRIISDFWPYNGQVSDRFYVQDNLFDSLSFVVAAFDSNGNYATSRSNQMKILRIEKPPTPNLLTPSNGNIGLINPVSLIWTKPLRVEKYKLQVSTDNIFGSFIVNDSNLTDTTLLLTNLDSYKQFYWRVKAVNEGGESNWSSVWNFKTLGNPYASNLITPLDASVNQPLNGLTFKWTKAKERIETIQKYQFQVSTDSLFTTTFINDSTLTDTTKVVIGMGYLTKYFWRVRAQNQTGWGDWSDTWRFTTIIEKPTAPVLASPANGSKGLLNPITAKWNKSLRVEKYKLQVSTDSLFGSLVVNDSTLTDTTKVLPNLSNYSQYYWRVKAVNVGGESDWSSIWNFKTLGNPYASNLITPLDASINQPLTGLTFKWTKAKERIETIQKYQFQVSTDSLFTTTFVNDSTLTDTTKIVGGLGYLTKYFWRVRAQNQTGWGDWSNTWRFTTIIEKPTVPVLALPVNGSKGLLNPITAEWNKSLRVEKYKLQVSTDSLFTALVVNDSTITDSSKVLPTLANYTQYYWRVKAVNVGGESDWSSVWNFKTLGNPYASNLITPLDASINQPLSGLTFKWTKAKERIETIQKYQFQVSTDSLFGSFFVNDSSLTDTTKVVNGMGYLTKYFWRVRAQNQTGWGDWSDNWRFTTIIEKPTAPVLALPINGSKGLLNPITAKWNKSLRVEKYKLQVSIDSLFGSFVVNDSTLADTAKLLPTLANYSQYYWRVKAVNVGGESDWSNVWNFKTLGNPYASNLITPADLSLNLPLNGLTFKWTKAKERIETIQKYQFQVSTDSLFTTTFVNDSSLTDTTKVVNGMGYLTKYFWRVRAQNQTGWGDWSNTWRFTTIIDKPVVPVLALPVNGDKGLLNPITTKWNKSLRVEKYKLQVSTDSLFGSLVVNDSTLADTAKLLPTLAYYSQYYWRVKAVNVGGESDWSSVWNFKTLGNPYASNLITPLEASINQPLDGLTFKWTKAKERIETIQKYQFQVSTDSLFGSFFVNDSTLTDTTKVVNGMGYLTKYFWRVRAQNQTGWGDWSNTWRFTTIVEKPSVPALALPVNGSKGLPNPVTVKWNKSLRPERYKLQISSDSLFTALVINDSTLTDTTKVLPNLANYSQYYWRVKAVNVGGESDWSNVWNFKTLGNPFASNLIAPADLAVNQAVNALTFQWTKAKERIETIQRYQLQISTDSLFTTTFVNDSTLTDTTKVVNGMGYLTKYFWRVRAQNQTGWGDWSNTWRFTTIIEKPAVPLLASPGNNATQLLQPVVLKWRHAPRVEKYTLEVSESSTFITLFLVDSTLTDTIRTLPQLLAPKTYYWRVRAANIGGSSAYSAVWNFRTLGLPLTVNLLAPANGQVDLPVTNVMLKWSTAGEQTLASGSVTNHGNISKFNKTDAEPEVESGKNLRGGSFVHSTEGTVTAVGSYWLQLGTDTLGVSFLISDSTLTDTTRLISGLSHLTTYYWRVKARNEAGWGEYSGWFRFTTVVERPGVTLLASPADQSTGLIQPLQFKWWRATRAEKYTLEISNDSLFANTVLRDTSLTDSSRSVNILLPLTKYYWRVFASNKGGTGDTSSVWNFKTLGVPTAVATAYPENNAQDLPVNLTFTWYRASNQEATIRYWFELVLDTTAGVVVRDTMLTDTTRTVNQIQYNMNYYWRVKSGNAVGWSGFSAWSKFKTMKRPIPAPAGLTATALSAGRVSLTWTDNSDNETGFIIRRKTGDSTSVATLVNIDTVGVNVTSFIDSLVADTTMYTYQVTGYNSETVSLPSNFAQVYTLTGIRELFAGEIPQKYELMQNYPNPFNPSTVIRFAIPKDSRVRIQLYTLQGEEIAELLSEDKNAGYYEIRLEIPELASGIYLYRIIATSNDGGEPFINTKKLILMK